MPTYHYFISAELDDLMPPCAELDTIEANDPYDAIEKLRPYRYRKEFVAARRLVKTLPKPGTTSTSGSVESKSPGQ